MLLRVRHTFEFSEVLCYNIEMVWELDSKLFLLLYFVLEESVASFRTNHIIVRESLVSWTTLQLKFKPICCFLMSFKSQSQSSFMILIVYFTCVYVG